MLGGQYLVATADSPATLAEVRMAAPEGEWYVYLSWVRHPHSAKDAVVHVGGSTIKVDQSRLASGSLYRQRPRHASLLLPHLGSRGMPLTVVLAAYLVDVTSNRLRLSEADTRRWGKSYVRVDAEGRLWLARTATQKIQHPRGQNLAKPGQ